MTEKRPPFTREFIESLTSKFPTPFHIYDEEAIRENAGALKRAFAWAPGFKEFFAVKATPNPRILNVLQDEGFGADCSSLTELILAARCGISGEEIMFTSNDTGADEFVEAKRLGALINLDDITHIDFLAKTAGFPKVISFRFNPGKARAGNAIIGSPEDAKYGLTEPQIIEAYKKARELGAERFGLHTMIASNELNPDYFAHTASMIFKLAAKIFLETKVRIEFVNLGGGFGIPYRPEDKRLDVDYISGKIKSLYEEIIVPARLDPLKLFLELGRFITGPYGYLVAKAIHKKETYKNYIGLDASMANLMRPALYGAYHHITVLGKEIAPLTNKYDVTGSLCENNDKFAIDRMLPKIETGDIIVIHDAGAHGHAMGFNYNGKLRSAELLLKTDGSVEMIRRAETPDDYFATLNF